MPIILLHTYYAKIYAGYTFHLTLAKQPCEYHVDSRRGNHDGDHALLNFKTLHRNQQKNDLSPPLYNLHADEVANLFILYKQFSYYNFSFCKNLSYIAAIDHNHHHTFYHESCFSDVCYCV